jgi:hypothetical protein
MGKRTLAYAQTWPTSGGPVVTHHIYRDDSMPDGVMVHQHLNGEPAREIWVPDGVLESAVKRDTEGKWRLTVNAHCPCCAKRDSVVAATEELRCALNAERDDVWVGVLTVKVERLLAALDGTEGTSG